MNVQLQAKAEELLDILRSLPGVQNCTLYGSLASGTQDDFSDIDINADVSGTDNGQFLLDLSHMLQSRVPAVYFDYAPSLAPEKYVVSFAMDPQHPFLICDLCITAQPHCPSVSREQLSALNSRTAHLMKLFTINLKHFLRGSSCKDDLLRMAQKMGIADAESKTEAQLLTSGLDWLIKNTADDIRPMLPALQKHLADGIQTHSEKRNQQ